MDLIADCEHVSLCPLFSIGVVFETFVSTGIGTPDLEPLSGTGGASTNPTLRMRRLHTATRVLLSSAPPISGMAALPVLSVFLSFFSPLSAGHVLHLLTLNPTAKPASVMNFLRKNRSPTSEFKAAEV